MINFSNFKVVETSNTKAGNFGGREALVYDMRYNRYESKAGKENGEAPTQEFFFEVGKAKFEALKLDQKGFGMVQTVDPASGISYLAVVDNDNAVIFKTTAKNEKGEKGRKFKSSIIEEALSQQGLIDKNVVGKPQYLNLSLVEGSEGVMLGDKVKTYGVYEIQKGEEPVATEKAPEAEATTESAKQPEAKVEPVAEHAHHGAAPTQEEEDF
jgi:hypothetical protein